MNETAVTKDGNVLTLERVIDAPRERVWGAYTNPDVFTKWWGPIGWTTTVPQFDFVPGGTMLYGMKCEDETQQEWFGKTSWGKMVFETVTPEEGFSYVDYFCDENGNVAEGMPAPRTTMTFEELDGRTKITSVSTYESEEALRQALDMGMEEGIKQTLDRLEALVH